MEFNFFNVYFIANSKVEKKKNKKENPMSNRRQTPANMSQASEIENQESWQNQ